MKKLLLFLAVMTANTVFAQKINRPTSQSNTVDFQSDLNSTFSVDISEHSIFNYNDDEVVVLLTESTKKLKNYLILIGVRNYETGTQLVRYNKKTKKISKPEIIQTPFRGDESSLLTSLHRGDSLLLINRYNNKTIKKDFVFATYYNMVTKKSKTIKVAEAEQKESVNVYSTQSGKYVVTSEVKSMTYKMSYAIYNFESELLSSEIDMSIPSISKKDNVELILTEKGNIIANVVKPIEGSGGFLRARKYENLLYLIKNKTAVKVDVEKLSTYGRIVIKKDREENYRVVCISKEKDKLGITVGTLDEEREEIVNERFNEITGFEFENEEEIVTDNKRKAARKERRKKAELSSMNYLSAIRFTDDNKMVVLLEHFYITVTTTTTTGSNGSTRTSRTTYYNYGPGILCSFDNQNTLLKHNELQYAKSFANYNPGIGLDFHVGNNDRIVLSEYNNYYKTNLTNEKQTLSNKIGEKATFGKGFSASLKATKKFYKGQLISVASFDNTIYQVNNHRRRSLDLTTYSME